MFENYKDSFFNDKIILKLQQRFRSYYHEVCTEGVNKIALGSNDDKRLQTFDKVTTFPYGTNVFKICESEMLSKNKTTIKTKTEDKDMTIHKTRTKTEDKDKTTPKTRTKTEDKDKTTPKTRTKTEDKDKTTPKTRTKTEDRLIQVFQHAKLRRNKKNGNWAKKTDCLDLFE